MTEEEWQQAAAGGAYYLMRAKQFVARTFSDRKARLFATACCRKAWLLLPPVFRDLIGEIEGEADAGAGPSRLPRHSAGPLKSGNASRRSTTNPWRDSVS